MMASGNFGSPTQLLILLAIVLLFFSGKRLRNLGSDLGGAIKGFKNSMSNGEADKNHGDDKSSHLLNGEQAQLLPITVEAEKNSVKHGSY